MAWRDLLRRQRQTPASQAVVSWADGGSDTSELPGMATLVEIESAALAVYAEHGLPVRRGHYRRGPRARRWEYLGESLDIGRRWDMVLDRPTGSGWRFAMLEDLGRYAAKPELVAASALLATCRRLRDRMAGKVTGDAGDDIECAIQLGVAWQKLQDSRPWKDAARLRLTVPDATSEVSTSRLKTPSRAAGKRGAPGRVPNRSG